MIISKNEQIQELQSVLAENVKELESLQECKYNLLAKLQNYIYIFISEITEDNNWWEIFRNTTTKEEKRSSIGRIADTENHNKGIGN